MNLLAWIKGKWPLKAKPKAEPVNVAVWLAEAMNKAQPSIAADVRLAELLASFRSVAQKDEQGAFRARNMISEHICQIVIDCLRRFKAGHVVVDCVISVEGQRCHAILTLETRGRVASRYMEFKG
jgi:hypothetical protein